jgi:hypothetical protein
MKRIAPALLLVALLALALSACSGKYTLPNTEPSQGVSYYKVTRTGNDITVEPYALVTPTPTPTTTPTVTPTPTITPTPDPTPTVVPPTGDVANILAYGAVSGDGADDSAAILAACRSGLPVYVPEGTYDAGTMTIPAGVVIYGDGASSWVRASFRFNSNSTYRNIRIGDVGDTHSPAVNSTQSIMFDGVSFAGGGNGYNGGIIGWNNRSAANITFSACTFERNGGVWTSNGGAGALWFAVDTGDGTIIRDIVVKDCHFMGQPTYGVVFWQSDEAGSGWWGDITFQNNVFEVTGEFTLDFDGNMNADSHNNVIIRGNLIKGAGLYHNGISPSWPYGICVEPARTGTVIENNTIGRCRQSPMKFTKGASGVVFQNNTIDLLTPNGVSLYWTDYFRTINIYDGDDNIVIGNTIITAGGTIDSDIISDEANNSTIAGNVIQ